MPPDHDGVGLAASILPIGQALVHAALGGADADDLVGVLGRALNRAGVAVTTIEVACDAVDPDRAQHFVRWRRAATQVEHALSAIDLFEAMLEDGSTMRRIGPASRRRGPDAVALIEHLAPAATLGFFDDVMSLFVTDRAGGFTEGEVALLRHTTPVFALAIGARLNADAARTLLRTYLGPDAATAMLDGRVGLGDVAKIRAVVLYCDLADFTLMTERLEPEALIARLNTFFDTITRPVARIGGQVAGHVGDAVVLYVSVPDADREPALCAAACRAAMEALDDLDRLPATDAAPFRARIGIDVGEVVHGNIGSVGRFSFSIIGTPVNRAARLQTLAKDLGAALLMPAALAEVAGIDGCALGTHALKGFDQPIAVTGAAMDRR